MPRFVILEHDHPQRHWDFMVEAGTVLQTWRLSAPPERAVEISAEKSFDHRLFYLDYEGPISGGRGSVSRWDAGTYETLIDEADQRLVRLCGNRLQGTVELKNQPDKGWTWRLI